MPDRFGTPDFACCDCAASPMPTQAAVRAKEQTNRVAVSVIARLPYRCAADDPPTSACVSTAAILPDCPSQITTGRDDGALLYEDVMLPKPFHPVVLCVMLVVAALAGTGAALQGQSGTVNGEWRTFGGDLGSTRYAPADQISAANFSKLEIAWRFKTDVFGPRPDFNLQATPLMVGGVLYTTVGSRRDAVAIDAATGELLWMYRIDEDPKRIAASPRPLSGRGVGYWTDGRGDARVFFVTVGYQLVGLDARTGRPIEAFGRNGIVDLKQQLDQDIDLITGEIGLNSAPVVARDVVIVGAAHRAGGAPRSK